MFSMRAGVARAALLRAALLMALLMTALLMTARMAQASDPLPGDAEAPPPNMNIVLYYNIFNNTGTIEPPHGTGYGEHTRVAVDVQALRYIRSFNVGGMLAGVQVVQPYASFLGQQVEGVAHLPPGDGPGRVTLTTSGGFLQPSFGAFVFPVADQARGRYVVAGFWFSPPISQYDNLAALSPSENLWMGELEAGTHLTLLGQPTRRNLALELWGEGYVYGCNGGATLAGLGGTAPATLCQQPSGEIRAYVPYVFYPPTVAKAIAGVFQSFGGKRYYTLPGGMKLDGETRTQETQLRFMVMSWLSPHWQLLLNAQYDVVAHGGPLNRALELRIGAIF